MQDSRINCPASLLLLPCDKEETAQVQMDNATLNMQAASPSEGHAPADTSTCVLSGALKWFRSTVSNLSSDGNSSMTTEEPGHV